MKKVANSKNKGHLLSKKLFNVRTIPIIATFFCYITKYWLFRFWNEIKY